MHRAVIEACAPWVAVLLAACVALRLVLACVPRPRGWERIRRLHSCDSGSVQTLSFVVTLPVFIMLVLFILQVSQMMIGITVVHYAAFAAARAAAVWLPAAAAPYPPPETPLGTAETPNRLAQPPAWNGANWVLAQSDFRSLDVQSVQGKHRKVWTAAAVACAPIAPSRPIVPQPSSGRTVQAVQALYKSLAPSSKSNPRIPSRLANKLTYSALHTWIQLQGVDKNGLSGPFSYNPRTAPHVYQWDPNEIDWEGPLTVTVWHRFALLPGPARLLATPLRGKGTVDTVSPTIQKLPGGGAERVYFRLLTASATLSNEGLKAVVPYIQPTDALRP